MNPGEASSPPPLTIKKLVETWLTQELGTSFSYIFQLTWTTTNNTYHCASKTLQKQCKRSYQVALEKKGDRAE